MALNIFNRFVILETINRQRCLMMAGPIAVALAVAIDKQLANAVRAERCDGDSFRHAASQSSAEVEPI